MRVCAQVSEEESREHLIKSHYMSRVAELTSKLQMADSKVVHFHAEVGALPCSIHGPGQGGPLESQTFLLLHISLSPPFLLLHISLSSLSLFLGDVLCRNQTNISVLKPYEKG